MKTIFLASGRSSRMNPISDKSLLEFCGKPLILHLLHNAEKGGLSDFIVVVNKDNHDSVKSILQAEDFSAEIVIQKDLEKGMSGGVSDALKIVADTEEVFVLCGNDYVDAKVYRDIVTQAENFDGGILAKKVTEYFPGGYLEVDENNKILSIVEKPDPENVPSDMVNIVGHFFKKAADLKQALAEAKSDQDDIYEVALDNLFKSKNFVAVEYDGFWQAIKFPWHVLEMMELFLKQQKPFIHETAEIAESANIKGDNVYIDKGAKIYDNAVILGPCYIGENAVVGNNALVRNSILGENSTAGYNTEIARSFVAKDVSTHIAYLGDSIVDDGVNFGAYSCTANLRLDKDTVKVKIKDQKIDSKHGKLGAIVGKKAQVGIHAMIMPGAKLESGEFLKPGKVLY